MPEPGRYTRHLNTVIAVMTDLALTESGLNSRTPPNLARDLGLPKADVEEAFLAFPDLFRGSRTTSGENGEHYYALRARWALRPRGDSEDPALPALRIDVLKALLEFVTQRAEAEESGQKFERELRRTKIQTRVAAGAAVAAAIASIIAAAIGH